VPSDVTIVAFSNRLYLAHPLCASTPPHPIVSATNNERKKKGGDTNFSEADRIQNVLFGDRERASLPHNSCTRRALRHPTSSYEVYAVSDATARLTESRRYTANRRRRYCADFDAAGAAAAGLRYRNAAISTCGGGRYTRRRRRRRRQRSWSRIARPLYADVVARSRAQYDAQRDSKEPQPKRPVATSAAAAAAAGIRVSREPTTTAVADTRDSERAPSDARVRVRSRRVHAAARWP
jgi:hypothetical protein